MAETVRFPLRPRPRLVDDGLGTTMPADIVRLRQAVAPQPPTGTLDLWDDLCRTQAALDQATERAIGNGILAGLGWFLAALFGLALWLVG